MALGILAILTLGVLSTPSKVNAQYDYGYSYTNQNPAPSVFSISPNIGNAREGGKTITISGSGFVPSSVARWNGSARPTTFIDFYHLLVYISPADLQGSSGRYINVYNPAPAGGYSNAVLFTIEGYVAPNVTNNYNNSNSYDPNSYLYTNTDNNYNNNPNYNQTSNSNNQNSNSNGSNSSLAANAIFGTSGVSPSGLIQWILVAIIILIIVIIVRKLFGGEARYHSTPLKHK